jgi:hypothetical protein
MAESAVMGRRRTLLPSPRSMMTTWFCSLTFSRTQMKRSDSNVNVYVCGAVSHCCETRRMTRRTHSEGNGSGLDADARELKVLAERNRLLCVHSEGGGRCGRARGTGCGQGKVLWPCLIRGGGREGTAVAGLCLNNPDNCIRPRMTAIDRFPHVHRPCMSMVHLHYQSRNNPRQAHSSARANACSRSSSSNSAVAGAGLP